MDKNKKIIFSPDQVEIDDNIQLQIARGKLITKIVKKENIDD